MSTKQEKEYYKKYMKEYYGKHKDYWRNYYLQRKKGSSKKSKSSYRNRRSYIAKISAAWYRPQKKKSRLGRLIGRFGRRSPSLIKASRLKTSSNSRKDNIEPVKQFRNILFEVLRKEDFLNIKFPEKNFEKIPLRNLSTFQVLAEKNNKKCMIEFVTSPFKVFTEKRREYLRTFLDFFDAKFFLCFIKPDFSGYCVLEIESSNIKSVNLGLKAIENMKPIPELI
ncbi:hypothetical protein [[Eubacterium] cellulosolvens]